MTHQAKHAEASLLYSDPFAPLADVDRSALGARLGKLGFPVRSSHAQGGDYIKLSCDDVQIVVAGFDLPFPEAHFPCVSRRSGQSETQRTLLALLAEHSSSLTVLVMDQGNSPNRLTSAQRTQICAETVEYLLETTDPDLVYWTDYDSLVTAAEAEAQASESRLAQPGDTARPQILPDMSPKAATRNVSGRQWSRSGRLDFNETEPSIEQVDVRPKRPALPTSRTDRPTHFWADPELSPNVVKWLEGTDEPPRSISEHQTMIAWRAFLALDDSPEPRRIADTALGRASLYLMSATIAVFALPIGAAILTYNALSGGSFRATSHVMALTGLGLALTSLGIPNPALALGIGF